MDLHTAGTLLLLLSNARLICADKEEVNIIEVWNTTQTDSSTEEWENRVKICQIKEVCPDQQNDCGHDKIKWKDLALLLENSTEIVIMDDQSFTETTVNLTLSQGDLEKLKSTFCDMTLIQKHGEECLILWIPNECPWENFSLEKADQETKCCDKKIIGKKDAEDFGFFPKNCRNGAGWDDSKLETIVEGDSYRINWASLLKQPSCVKSVTLFDEKEKQRKKFYTTWSDNNFPIEYRKNTCEVSIKFEIEHSEDSNEDVYESDSYSAYEGTGDSDTTDSSALPDDYNYDYYDQTTSEGTACSTSSKCFFTETKVKCEDVALLRSPSNTENSVKTKNIAIICGTVALVVILITTVALIKIAKKRGKRGVKNKKEPKEEENDLYGTYSQGTEYNTATEDNPRYNEDGGNDDAVVIDENTYYDNPKDTNDMGNNGPTSPNGNIYFQL